MADAAPEQEPPSAEREGTVQEEVQRARLGQDAKIMLDAQGEQLAHYYSGIAEDEKRSPEVREASMLYSLGEESLQEEEVDQAIERATDAMQLFKSAGIKAGVQDSQRLSLCAKRRKETPDAIILEAQELMKQAKEDDDIRAQVSLLLVGVDCLIAKCAPSEALQLIEDERGLMNAQEVGDKKLETSLLLLQSKCLLAKCQFPEAIEAANAAITCASQAGERVLEGQASLRLAAAQKEAGDANSGLQSARAALALFRELEHPRFEIISLQMIAEMLVYKEQPRLAQQSAEQALALCRQVGYHQAEGAALHAVIVALVERGDLKKATKLAEEGLQRFERDGNKRGQAAAYGSLSYILFEKKELNQATAMAEQQLALQQELNDRLGQVLTLLQLSSVHCDRHRNGEAISAAEQAYSLAEEIQDKKDQAMAAYSKAVPTAHEQKEDEALGLLDAARGMFDECGDRRGEVKTLMMSGFLKASKGEADVAKNKLNEAKHICLEIGDKRDAIRALIYAADLYTNMQAEGDAIGASEEALELAREIAWSKGQVLALTKAAMAYAEKKDNDTAKMYALEAKKITRLIEDPRGEANVYTTLAVLGLIRAEHYGEAAKALEGRGAPPDNKQLVEAHRDSRRGVRDTLIRAKEALILAKKQGDHHREALALYYCAHAMASLGRTKEAIRAAEEAEGLFRDCGDQGEQANSVCLMAEIHHLDPKKKQKALDIANRALEMATKCGDARVAYRCQKTVERIEGRTAAAAQPVYDQGQFDAAPGVQQAAAVSAGPVRKGLDLQMVTSKLQHVVGQVSGSGDEVHLDTPLMESGMDSLSAVAFRNELSRSFEGIGNLPAALMFDYPNMRSIASHIVDRSLGRG